MVVVLPKENSDSERLDTSATVVVVNMPNIDDMFTTTSAANDQWRSYFNTIICL
jgi:endonuclease G